MFKRYDVLSVPARCSQFVSTDGIRCQVWRFSQFGSTGRIGAKRQVRTRVGREHAHCRRRDGVDVHPGRTTPEKRLPVAAGLARPRGLPRCEECGRLWLRMSRGKCWHAYWIDEGRRTSSSFYCPGWRRARMRGRRRRDPSPPRARGPVRLRLERVQLAPGGNKHGDGDVADTLVAAWEVSGKSHSLWSFMQATASFYGCYPRLRPETRR